jgi:hypothetical protein
MFTDRDAWMKACNGTANIDFEGIAPPGSYTDFSTTEGLTVAGINFVGNAGSANYLAVVDSSYGPAFYDWGSGAVLLGGSRSLFGPPSSILVNLNKGFTCVGSDVMSFNYPSSGYGDTIVVTLSTGEEFSLDTYDYPNRAFIGFTSDAPVTSVTFAPTGSEAWPELDNFAFGDLKGAASRPRGIVVEPPRSVK